MHQNNWKYQSVPAWGFKLSYNGYNAKLFYLTGAAWKKSLQSQVCLPRGPHLLANADRFSNFVVKLLCAFVNATGWLMKKVAILCSQITFLLVNFFSRCPSSSSHTVKQWEDLSFICTLVQVMGISTIRVLDQYCCLH